MAVNKDVPRDAVKVFVRLRRRERGRVLAVQRYWLHIMEREYRTSKRTHERRVVKKNKDRDMKAKYPNEGDLLEAYMAGAVDDAEYIRARRMLKDHNRYDDWKYGDRMRWLELQIREQKALIAELEDHMNDEVVEQKVRKAYDSSRRVSKYNFPRTDLKPLAKMIQENKSRYHVPREYGKRRQREIRYKWQEQAEHRYMDSGDES